MVSITWTQIVVAILLLIGGPRAIGAILGRGVWALWLHESVKKLIHEILTSEDRKKAEADAIAAALRTHATSTTTQAEVVATTNTVLRAHLASPEFHTALATAVKSEPVQVALTTAFNRQMEDAIRRDDGLIRTSIEESNREQREEITRITTAMGQITNQLGRIEGMLSVLNVQKE